MVVLMRHAFLSLVLLVTAAGSASRINAQEAQVIEISAERFSFNPSEIRVRAGT